MAPGETKSHFGLLAGLSCDTFGLKQTFLIFT